MTNHGAYHDALRYGQGITRNGRHITLQEVFVTKDDAFPTYICHKRVKAAEILAVAPVAHDGFVRVIVNGYPDAFVPEDALARYKPQIGDFLVIYEDGYRSFSPRKAFVEGYSPALNGNVLMERLNDLATAVPGNPIMAEWLNKMDWAKEVGRVAREAYVTINSLKQQVERLQERVTPRADGTAIMDRIIEALQIDYYPGSAALNDLLRDCSAEITRLRADVTVTRQMAGFKEVKREKADPDQT